MTGFVRCMASPASRATRVAAGLGLLAWGLRHLDRGRGRALAAGSVVPLAAGAFDVCVPGPLRGFPLDGAATRAATS